MRINSEIKEEIKEQYLRLSEVFEGWYFNKLKEINKKTSIKNPPRKILKKLAISKKEFYNIYINPFKNLSKHDLNIVFKLLAFELLETYTKESTIIFDSELKYDLSMTRKKNALNWLLFQVDLLGIFNLSEKLKKFLIVPYHQCYYCGKPNNYIKNNIIKKFNLKEVYCHKDKCKTSSNPDKHDNCCYAKWTRRRKSLEKALKEAEKLADDIIENYEDNNASTKQKAILENKLDKIFIAFCENQYKENMKINYTIQEHDNKAICLLQYSI